MNNRNNADAIYTETGEIVEQETTTMTQNPTQQLMPQNAMLMQSAQTGMTRLTIDGVKQMRADLQTFFTDVLAPGVDFSIPPEGKEGARPSLLKPGAEKLTWFFRLQPHFNLVNKIEDWTGADHGGEPLFYYEYECSLVRDGVVVGQGFGSCNSREAKYRWRNAGLVCPVCGKENIRVSKHENSKGDYYCWTNLGGCGATFPKNEPAIVNQPRGRVLNDDIYDIVNTVQKMGQKRAFVAGVILATGCSDIVTQDMEDEHERQRTQGATPREQGGSEQARQPAPPPADDGDKPEEAAYNTLKATFNELLKAAQESPLSLGSCAPREHVGAFVKGFLSEKYGFEAAETPANALRKSQAVALTAALKAEVVRLEKLEAKLSKPAPASVAEASPEPPPRAEPSTDDPAPKTKTQKLAESYIRAGLVSASPDQDVFIVKVNARANAPQFEVMAHPNEDEPFSGAGWHPLDVNSEFAENHCTCPYTGDDDCAHVVAAKLYAAANDIPASLPKLADNDEENS